VRGDNYRFWPLHDENPTFFFSWPPGSLNTPPCSTKVSFDITGRIKVIRYTGHGCLRRFGFGRASMLLAGKNRGLRQETGILALITLLADCGPEAGLLGKQIEAAGDKLGIRPGGPSSMGSRRILEGSQGTH
jgi:hypothetical protein